VVPIREIGWVLSEEIRWSQSTKSSGPNHGKSCISDFSRNFLPNTGGGTDHAWGSHPFVIGGAVKGGQIYGTMPTLELSGPDDASDLGRWIPTIAVDQFAATLASWFGADASALAAVLPNLAAFSPANIGFI